VDLRVKCGLQIFILFAVRFK